MSRYLDWFESVTPEEYPPRVSPAPDGDTDTRKARGWTDADVYAYRSAMAELGFSKEQIDAQIAKDCGPEFVATGMLVRRQA